MNRGKKEEKIIKGTYYFPERLYARILQERDNLDPHKLLGISVSGVIAESCRKALLDKKMKRYGKSDKDR